MSKQTSNKFSPEVRSRAVDCHVASASPACAMRPSSGPAKQRCSVSSVDLAVWWRSRCPRQERVCGSQRQHGRKGLPKPIAVFRRPNARTRPADWRANCRVSGTLGSNGSAWWWTQPASNRSPLPNSRVTGKLTANSVEPGLRAAILAPNRQANSIGYRPNSLRNAAGNFQNRIRVNFSANRESPRSF
jgi:hypothetical protein